MTITWLGQSGYLLKEGETKLTIDPYLSDIVNKVANRPRLVDPPILPEEIKGAVICTHDHLDHLDPDAIVKMDREALVFYAPDSCRPHLEELGCKNIRSLNLGETVEIGPFSVTGVFADHSVDAIGLLVRVKGHSFYFTGDTLWNDRLTEISKEKPEILFVCINGKLGNMNAAEAVRLTKAIAPKAAVPTHYGMFASNTEDPLVYTKEIDNGFIMELGKEVTPEEILAGAGK